MKDGWQIYVHGHWSGDPFVELRAVAPEPPRVMLQVWLPPDKSYSDECSGRYDTVGEWANGYPVWKQRAGSCWLYSATDGRWYIGGHEKRGSGFQAPVEG